MTKKKPSETLHHPIAKTRWEAARAAERITYATPPRLSWRDRGNYVGAELQHRSMRSRPASVVMGRRIERNASQCAEG